MDCNTAELVHIDLGKEERTANVLLKAPKLVNEVASITLHQKAEFIDFGCGRDFARVYARSSDPPLMVEWIHLLLSLVQLFAESPLAIFFQNNLYTDLFFLIYFFFHRSPFSAEYTNVAISPEINTHI